MQGIPSDENRSFPGVNGLSITQQQLDNLLASNKVFQDVAIKISEILQDPSRVANYQSVPGGERQDRNMTAYDNHKPCLAPRFEATGEGSERGKSLPSITELSVDRSPMSFASEKLQARKLYAEKRTRALQMYTTTAFTNLAAEYHFQFKFFPNKIYAELEHNPKAAGFDTWSWLDDSPKTLGYFGQNLEYQLHDGNKLRNSVRYQKAELMEALFPLRTNHILQSMSWLELEYSYSLHLKDVIRSAGFRKSDNAIGSVDSDVSQMIIEIGRFFTEIDYSNRSSGFRERPLPHTIGPFVNGPWPAEVRTRYTLHDLHDRCKSKGLLTDWDGVEITRMTFNPGSGKHELTRGRRAELKYILEIIFAVSRGTQKMPSLSHITEEDGQLFILDFLAKFENEDSGDLEETSAQTFNAELLNVDHMKRFGGLKLAWTDCIDDHLRLSPSTRTVKVFWDVSLLDQSLLFWYNAKCLKKNFLGHHPNKGIYTTNAHVLHELRITYRILFHNNAAKKFSTTETCLPSENPKASGILINNLRVNTTRRRVRKILKNFLDMPLPVYLHDRHEAGDSKSRIRKKRWWVLERYLLTPVELHLLEPLKRYIIRPIARQTSPFLYPEPNTIASLDAAGPPYPLDFCWHLENLVKPHPHPLRDSEREQAFAHFPCFSDRVRELAFYMDNQKPGNWYQMWKDKRDRVQYVTFWAVLIFGGISILLALMSIAVSSAQTAAAFRAIGGGK